MYKKAKAKAQKRLYTGLLVVGAMLATETMCPKLLPGAIEEVYVYWGFKHGFVRMTMPEKSCATPRGHAESGRNTS
jgi:hypothetical protein